MDTPVALVTGASSGIGREAALDLNARGITVYGAARRAMPELEDRGIHTLPLDVTDETSMTTCVETLIQREGRIDILVNDAGYGSYGAIEDMPLTEARRQFEVNVFGAMRLTQLILPHMIDAKRGRIVNISSMGGRFSMAFGGWYHATKYAVEALSDALRQEVRSFGVDVVIIEPGLIHTEWPTIAADHLRSTSGLGRYADLARNFATALELAGRGFATDPAVIGRVVAHAATTAHPRTRYRRGAGAIAITTATALAPDRVFDFTIKLLLTHLDQILRAFDSVKSQGE
ncbi:MAG: SDR family NAD(P)-dependent oxidoreductase [Propionibacteriaceae bacterium]|jgi:NAD(P)-dependent dehydrogenase (short-subunit alcohol dehydrogenase family)|nr:SDR family NAD(P)-dependent oxidoreductase [Propionibacteriaceae bacterium]